MTAVVNGAVVRRPYRPWFLWDGLVTAVNAIAYLGLAVPLAGLLGSSPALSLTAGGILALVVVGLLVVAGRRQLPSGLARLLVAVNIVWALASFVLALVNPFGLTGVGIVWTVAQGVVVLAFAVFQARALRAGA